MNTMNDVNSPNKKLLDAQPGNGNTNIQEMYPSAQEVLQETINNPMDYPVPEEVMQQPISKPVTPYDANQNPGYDNINRNSPLDAPGVSTTK